MSQVIAQRATARFSAVVTAMPQALVGEPDRARLRWLRPSRFAFGAVLMLLAACEGSVTEPNTTRYGQGAFWQGGVCVTRTPLGKLVRVAPANCPSKTEAEASSGGTTTSN